MPGEMLGSLICLASTIENPIIRREGVDENEKVVGEEEEGIRILNLFPSQAHSRCDETS
jgi:hypothetical protein